MGNSAGFVEPLESTSLSVIADESRMLAEILYETDCEPTPTIIRSYNEINARAWDSIRGFLALHYKFNTRLGTPFWRACQNDIELGPIQRLVEYYQENGPSTFPRTTLIHGNDIFGLEGYLTVLVGQKAPHRRPYTPTPDERTAWNAQIAMNRSNALSAMSVREALDVVTAPNWRWTPGFFGARSASSQPTSSQLTSFIGAASKSFVGISF